MPHACGAHLGTAAGASCALDSGSIILGRRSPPEPAAGSSLRPHRPAEQKEGGGAGGKVDRGGPLGEQDSANCGSGSGWPLGGEFQREERSPLLTAQSAENSRR